jgi:hypothetical protein
VTSDPAKKFELGDTFSQVEVSSDSVDSFQKKSQEIASTFTNNNSSFEKLLESINPHYLGFLQVACALIAIYSQSIVALSCFCLSAAIISVVLSYSAGILDKFGTALSILFSFLWAFDSVQTSSFVIEYAVIFGSSVSLFYYLSKLGTQSLENECLLVLQDPEEEVSLLDPSTSFSEKLVPIHSVRTGDLLRIYADQVVTCDGIVISGVAEVEQRLASGQSRYCIKGKGDPIFAGSSLLSGTIDIKVISSCSNSNFSKAVESLKSQWNGKQPISDSDNINTINYALKIVYLSAFIFALSGIINKNFFNLSLINTSLILSSIPLLFLAKTLNPILVRHLLISSFGKGLLFSNFLSVFRRVQNIFSVTLLDVSAYAQGNSETIIEGVEEVGANSSTPKIISFDILDDRVDPEVLKSIIVSILGRSESTSHLSIANFVRSKIKSFRLFELQFADTESEVDGLADNVEATIEGARIRLGSEQWLISKGIMINPNYQPCVGSNNLTESFDLSTYYVAMAGDVVAVFYGTKFKNFSNLLELTTSIGQNGIDISIISDIESQPLTDLALQHGVSLENICSVSNQESIVKYLSEKSSSVLISQPSTPAIVEAAASIVAKPYSYYDRVSILNSSDSFYFLNSQPYSISWFILASKKCASIITSQTVTSSYVCAATILLSAFGLVSVTFMPLILFSSGLLIFYRR